jgi:hypothetical protein
MNEEIGGQTAWTTDKPTMPGWYWYRNKPAQEAILVRFDGINYFPMDSNAWLDLGEWSGPITPPE